jgi:hypothetical protein
MSISRRQLVLRFGVEIAGMMSLVQLARGVTHHAVDHPTTLDRWPRADLVGPADDVFVFLHSQELSRIVDQPFHQRAVPRPYRHIGNRIFVARHIFAGPKIAVEHIELPLHLHGKPVDGIFHLERRISVKMPEPSAQIWRRAHLPHQPAQRFGAHMMLGRQERAKLLSEIQKDRTRFEYPRRLGCAVVEQSRDFRVGIGLNKAARKVIAFVNADQLRIIFRTFMTERKQLLQHHSNLDAVGSGK